jgi:uncharacterized protein
MDVIYSLNGSEFEWNAAKAVSNYEKHGIAFEQAAETFFDPGQQLDDASVPHERRDYLVGYNFAGTLLMTVYVERGVRTRIISARPATPKERRNYESGE